MEGGMEDFWYGMIWNGRFQLWNGMENFACYGIWKIYVPFHSMPCTLTIGAKGIELTFAFIQATLPTVKTV